MFGYWQSNSYFFFGGSEPDTLVVKGVFVSDTASGSGVFIAKKGPTVAYDHEICFYLRKKFGEYLTNCVDMRNGPNLWTGIPPPPTMRL